MGGGQDRHVIQMIANASLDVIEEVMRKDNAMLVYQRVILLVVLSSMHKVFEICGQVQRVDSISFYYARE
jgi:hypothetical protein